MNPIFAFQPKPVDCCQLTALKKLGEFLSGLTAQLVKAGWAALLKNPAKQAELIGHCACVGQHAV